MIFYIEPKGCEILEFVAKNCEFIGALNSTDENSKKIQKSDISIENIENKLKENKFLIAVIFYNTWQICILANTKDGLTEISSKYGKCLILWYWIDQIYIKECLPNIQYKEFKKIFNK